MWRGDTLGPAGLQGDSSVAELTHERSWGQAGYLRMLDTPDPHQLRPTQGQMSNVTDPSQSRKYAIVGQTCGWLPTLLTQPAEGQGGWESDMGRREDVLTMAKAGCAVAIVSTQWP